MGCLLAGIRAENGRVIRPRRLPEQAVFEAPPDFPAAHGTMAFAAVAAPYLSHPATTLGLGDTFMAGCLLVLGQDSLHAPEQ